MNPGVGAAAPKDTRASQNQEQLQRREEISIMQGVPIGNRAEIAEMTEGEKVPVREIGMEGKVLEGMKAHS